MKMVKTLKNEVLMRSSHKLRFKRRKYIHSIEQPLISVDLKYFMIQMKLRFLKSILQSRSSLLPSYCITWTKTQIMHPMRETKEKSLLIFQPLFAKGRLIFEFVVMERIAHCKSRGSKEVSNLLSTTAIRQRVLSEG